MKHLCKFCNKIFSTGQKLGGHIVHCTLNPEFDIKIKSRYEVLSSTMLKYQSEKNGNLINKKKQCYKCGTKFKILERKFKNKKKYFCSISCANSRIVTDSMKKKVSQTFQAKENSRKILQKTCEYCGDEYETKKINQRFCSRSCVSSNHMNTPESKERAKSHGKKYLARGNKNPKCCECYDSKFAGRVLLESSYESKVARELDENNIKWSRPAPIKWIDNLNETHNYFPDFYLIDYDVYLDPKNDWLIQRDSDKIYRVQLQNSVKILILNKYELTIKSILDKIAHVV